ncbi:MAG: N-acetylglucosamine-6-phosphate deacetylase [Oscillospiraceae bacterium]|nr:N-acetylglucosamine-6-phosphate deacetylase [Oscillospiraceae bacterium]
MTDTVLKDMQIYITDRKCFVKADITVENGKFADILYSDYKDSDECVIPGFIDIHSHGAFGIDMINADADKLCEMSGYYGENGITSLFPTTSSEKHDVVMRMIEEVKKARKNDKLKINFEGIHIEGPYINPKKRGAHNPDLIKLPNLRELDDIMAAVLDCGLKLHITIAPELDGAYEFITAAVKRGATISIGHSEADGETVKKAIELGVRSFTHLFNAMPQIHHRNAGTAGYALINDTYVEIICDGIHLCPDIVNLVNKIKTDEKIMLVSDSMAAAGLPEGIYNLGSAQGIIVENGKAFIKNADGTETIAGSTTNLFKEINNFMNFTGRNLADSLWTVTKNPAECVGIYDRKGEIAKGKDADFIIWDRKNNKIKSVYVGGKEIL